MLVRPLVAGSVLYIFDVSVSGQTYCLLEQILESYEGEKADLEIALYLHDLTQTRHTGHDG